MPTTLAIIIIVITIASIETIRFRRKYSPRHSKLYAKNSDGIPCVIMNPERARLVRTLAKMARTREELLVEAGILDHMALSMDLHSDGSRTLVPIKTVEETIDSLKRIVDILGDTFAETYDEAIGEGVTGYVKFVNELRMLKKEFEL